MSPLHSIRCLLLSLTAALLALPPMARADAPAPLHLLATEATLEGPVLATTRPGYAGPGFATGFHHHDDRMIWTLPHATPGIYTLRIHYCSHDDKHCDLLINGRASSVPLPATNDTFADTSAGKIELTAGQNTLTLANGWGYFDIDSLDLRPYTVDLSLKPVPNTLADPAASPEARALMTYLLHNYGRATLSGQHQRKDLAYVRATTGKSPAIFSTDFGEYSPTRIAHGTHPRGTAEALIAMARQGHIITLSFHWNAPADLYDSTYVDAHGKTIDAPWWRGPYTDASTFDIAKVLAAPDSPDYQLLLRDIDALAVQLKKLADAHIPILWRPLHEAEGTWFWWGGKGPDAFKQLWRLLFTRLTVHAGLHNLLWVYTSGGKMDWYPGDAYVDIVGTDAYPVYGDPLSGIYDTLKTNFDGRKLLALTEIGAAPDLDTMRRFGVQWSYFVSWEDSVGPRTLPIKTLTALYDNPTVITAAQLPPPFQPTPDK